MSAAPISDTGLAFSVEPGGACVWEHPLTVREEEILDAVVACMNEEGLARMSVADIAERAHASKATLYRRFGSREGLILAAFARQARGGWEPVDSGNLRDDLVHCANKMGLHMANMGSTLAELGAEMRHNPDLAALMRSQFFASLNELIAPAFERAAARGEVTTEVDTALIWEAVKATMLYRIVFLNDPVGDLPAELIDRVVMPAVQACRS